MLDPALQSEILRLCFAQKLPQRQIADILGVNSKSVAAVIRRRSVKGKKDFKRRRSILDPYYPLIDKLLNEAPMRSSVNILQHLRGRGFHGEITILRDYVKAIRPTPPKEAFMRIEYFPGEVAQVDWGEFGDVFCDGTKVHCFVMVSCYSGAIYLEFTLSETLPCFLRCHERAIRFFGGIHHEYWYDNMAQVVAERIGKVVRFNPRFLTYSGFHAFKPVAMNPRRGWEKGSVENGVKFVRNSFWPGRSFKDLDDSNAQAIEWRDRFANLRERKGKIPKLLLEEERSSLMALREEPYDTDDVLSPTVRSNHRVYFESNTYTVPWTMVGKTVTLRANDREVEIFYGSKRIAHHKRSYKKKDDIPNEAHEEGLLEIKPGAEMSSQIEAIRSLGPHGRAYLEIIGAGTRSLKREISALLVLRTVYGAVAVEEAIGEALSKAVVGASNVERILRLKDCPQKNAPPMEVDERLKLPLPRADLTSYNALLFEDEEER